MIDQSEVAECRREDLCWLLTELQLLDRRAAWWSLSEPQLPNRADLCAAWWPLTEPLLPDWANLRDAWWPLLEPLLPDRADLHAAW